MCVCVVGGGHPLTSQYWPHGDRREWPVQWGGVILSPLNTDFVVTRVACTVGRCHPLSPQYFVVTDRSGLYSGVVSTVILSPLNTDFVVTDRSGLYSGVVMSSHFSSAV